MTKVMQWQVDPSEGDWKLLGIWHPHDVWTYFDCLHLLTPETWMWIDIVFIIMQLGFNVICAERGGGEGEWVSRAEWRERTNTGQLHHSVSPAVFRDSGFVQCSNRSRPVTAIWCIYEDLTPFHPDPSTQTQYIHLLHLVSSSVSKWWHWPVQFKIRWCCGIPLFRPLWK